MSYTMRAASQGWAPSDLVNDSHRDTKMKDKLKGILSAYSSARIGGGGSGNKSSSSSSSSGREFRIPSPVSPRSNRPVVAVRPPQQVRIPSSEAKPSVSSPRSRIVSPPSSASHSRPVFQRKQSKADTSRSSVSSSRPSTSSSSSNHLMGSVHRRDSSIDSVSFSVAWTDIDSEAASRSSSSMRCRSRSFSRPVSGTSRASISSSVSVSTTSSCPSSSSSSPSIETTRQYFSSPYNGSSDIVDSATLLSGPSVNSSQPALNQRRHSNLIRPGSASSESRRRRSRVTVDAGHVGLTKSPGISGRSSLFSNTMEVALNDDKVSEVSGGLFYHHQQQKQKPQQQRRKLIGHEDDMTNDVAEAEEVEENVAVVEQNSLDVISIRREHLSCLQRLTVSQHLRLETDTELVSPEETTDSLYSNQLETAIGRITESLLRVRTDSIRLESELSETRSLWEGPKAAVDRLQLEIADVNQHMEKLQAEVNTARKVHDEKQKEIQAAKLRMREDQREARARFKERKRLIREYRAMKLNKLVPSPPGNASDVGAWTSPSSLEGAPEENVTLLDGTSLDAPLCRAVIRLETWSRTCSRPYEMTPSLLIEKYGLLSESRGELETQLVSLRRVQTLRQEQAKDAAREHALHCEDGEKDAVSVLQSKLDGSQQAASVSKKR